MFDPDKIEYSTKPITLRERILCQSGANGDFSAMHAYICSRTNLTVEEAFELDDEDVTLVLEGINQGFQTSLILQNMLKTSDD